jgi:trehalose-phosphatase
MTTPATTLIPSDLRDALTDLAETERLLVASDFDGTLAPIVEHPEDARPLPAAKAALEKLHTLQSTTVALVSGRALESLYRVSGFSGDIWAAGSHGVELSVDESPNKTPLTPREEERFAKLKAIIRELVDLHQGTKYEEKPAGVALHTRGLSEQEAAAIEQNAADRVRDEVEGATVRDGKAVIEFSIRPANKGDALIDLKDRSRATAVLWAGDDVTDEDGFRVLTSSTNVTIRIGDGDTAARFRVASPEAFAEALTLLAELRAGVEASRA